MSDAARSARPLRDIPASNAAPALAVVSSPTAGANREPADALADALVAALGGGEPAPARVRIDAQADQITLYVEADGDPDPYRLSEVARAHGAALTVVTRQGESACVGVLLPRPRQHAPR